MAWEFEAIDAPRRSEAGGGASDPLGPAVSRGGGGGGGRGRGGAAAAADESAELEPACVVLDSPYASFEQLAVDLTRAKVAAGFSAPAWALAQIVLPRLEAAVAELADFSTRELRPLRCAPLMRRPALFVHARDDKLLGPHHAEALVAKYGGPCALATCEGGHSAHPRDELTLARVGAFLREHLAIDDDDAPPLAEVEEYFDSLPWTRDLDIVKHKGLSYGLVPEAWLAHGSA